MSVFIRHDGVRFAFYTYRDVLYSTRASVLRQEISDLQRENGDYARFVELGGGEVEVVFSNEPGYLLAESVSHYLGQPDNLIYCEQIADQENAVLIIIKEGVVFLDALLPISLLIDEFFSLTTSTNIHYSIYAYGDIPLGTDTSDEKFSFPKEMVSSLKWLESPLIPRIEVDPAFQLLPIQEAFDELEVAKSNLPKYFTITVLVLAVGFLMYWLLKPKEIIVPVVQPLPSKPVYVDPYADYKQALLVPSAQAVMLAFNKEVEKLISISGWQVSHISLSNNKIIASLEQQGGSADILLALLAQRNLILQIDNGKATITSSFQLPNRSEPVKIYDIRSLVAQTYDNLRLLVDASSIKLNNLVKENNYVMQQMSVDVTDITPSIMNLFGKELGELPIILGDMQFSVEEGFMSGTINFTVLGATQT